VRVANGICEPLKRSKRVRVTTTGRVAAAAAAAAGSETLKVRE
jgi:hypothetical protein